MERGMTILENTNAKRIKRAYNAFMNSETRFHALYNLEQLRKAIIKYNGYKQKELYAIEDFLCEEKKYIIRAYNIALGDTGTNYHMYKFNIVARSSEETNNMFYAWRPICTLQDMSYIEFNIVPFSRK